MLKSATDERDAEARLHEWAELRESDTEIALAFYRPMVIGDLAGRLFVFDVEVQGRLRKLKDEPRPAFLSLPFTEAIEYARTRGLVDDEGLADVLARYRKRGEEAASLLMRVVLNKTLEHLRENLKEAQQRTAEHITSAVTEGTTLREFIAKVEADSVALGIGPRHHGYLETVFRTGVQSAYGAGRFKAMTSPAVMEARPYVEYRTVGDGDRVRESHRALDRKQWPITNKAWHRYAPPNGFNCRCSMVTLDSDEVDERQLNRALDPIAQPDAGFDTAPVEMVELPLVASAST